MDGEVNPAREGAGASEMAVLPAVAENLEQEDVQKPVKKATRQWAAWTHQEEESFFNALRQVGKNFEKITYRVQSKNRNQVRHYYYRLVRRMKKLLGPGFYFDAKNSKDTIAAMLRWWSLLEKFSCSASKLHLKPRRFKTFVEALGNQLQKDRKKSRRKRRQEDTHLSSSPMNEEQNNDSDPSKFTAAGAQNVDPTKGTLLKRLVEGNSSFKVGTIRRDLPVMRTVKQKRKSGGVAAASAYKKWERAAMAGVSLVADAAEQLERTTACPDPLFSVAAACTASPKDICVDNGACPNHIKEVDVHASLKLKLQLFPFGESVRKALEKEEHNPHLELTLSGRKKITSVMEHLNRKWGNSSVASGELVLFPYGTHQDDLTSQQKWTMKDVSTVADVFASVGCPAIFRLRYGWFSQSELESDIGEVCSPARQCDNCVAGKEANSKHMKIDQTKAGASLSNCEQPLCQTSTVPSSAIIREDGDLPESATKVLDRTKSCNLSEAEWADSLIDVSIGYLLDEASRDAKHTHCLGLSVADRPSCPEDIPFNYDSFDAAVAANASGPSQSTMWGAEETCDGFSFNLVNAPNQDGSNPSTSAPNRYNDRMLRSNSMHVQGYIQDFEVAEVENYVVNNIVRELDSLEDHALPDSGGTNTILKDRSLADIYWPDSLGPLDLEPTPVRYPAHDVVLCDSQNSWSRMMASSLDAFRTLSFVGTEKNE